MLYKFLVSLAIFFLIISVNFADSNICETRNCRLIIDAGSSGSRAHLYAYDLDENKNPININDIYIRKINPGFSSIKPDAVGAYLDNLFSTINEKNIDTYFYATAGMRLLPKNKQQVLYDRLKQWFNAHPEWKLHDARTISGAEEGVFGWLATNYSLNSLKSSDQSGFIEIGGASTQIVFPITNIENINHEDIITIKLSGKNITLFSHSFLGFGANSIAERFKNISACFPIGYPLPNNDTGLGDAISCEHEISVFINANDYIHDVVKLAINNNPHYAWYTVGAASMISQKSPLNFHDKFSIDELLQRADNVYCKQDWLTEVSQYKDDPYLSQNCLISSYLYSLSVDGSGFDPKQVFNNIPDDKNGDWTMGALINKISSLKS